MAATSALRQALNQGISCGNLIDTKIILYSHRDSSGRICRPKALYSNSRILKTVPYFEDLLFGNFAESQSKDFKEAIDEVEFGEDYGYLSDSDLEDDEDEKFQAFLMYLYTNAIEFAQFGSEVNRRSRSAEIVDPSHNKVPRPSPKSIYRLADKYDIPALKTLALDHIRSGLRRCDIVGESFSVFASRYAEVRSLYADQLACIWKLDPAIRVRVGEKIDSFVEGDLDHATEILSALWKTANEDGTTPVPWGPSPDATQVTSSTHWPAVNTALIKSIRTGVFFDSKYWARHLRNGNTLKPVYFSSMIMEDAAHQLGRLIKYLKGQNTTVSDLEGDANVESDCEGDSPGAREGSPTEKEEETCVVLITGSFAAWKSLFFYLCTDTISFALLKSQGVESRLNYIREKTVATAPAPCSPKSIYLLATLLENQPLCDSALADIKCKMKESNVSEFLLWVTTIHEKFTAMGCELLISNIQNAKTTDLVNENIGHTSASALNYGLKRAFEKRPPLARFRCINRGCEMHSNPPSYSSIALHGYRCQMCHNQFEFECGGCGSRAHGSTRCQLCGWRFIT
ncbi:hypothetical protein BJ322DRAFT_1039080 [Thelephora terrestris]|uniref:BTB domain-containing protein n=1 Tax=Thelephora terrestris TaxID=56493 RepID=A0A9P6HN05_9AGAM|nr:hypothetical protein BJ322DRAFT_1039080 [Thelephora terrestris]